MTTVTYVRVGNPAISALTTETEFTVVETDALDAYDLALMDEAERDAASGLEAPIGDIFAAVRSDRREPEAVGSRTAATASR